MCNDKFRDNDYCRDIKAYNLPASNRSRRNKVKEPAVHINTVFSPEFAPKSNNSTSIDFSKTSKKSDMKPQTMFGHLAYAEADKSTLTTLSSNKNVKGNKQAVKALDKMATDAKKEGINLTVISGFRSIERQKQLFYGKAQDRGQTPEQRARLSAPPKFSEHHTGYAFDLSVDGKTEFNSNFDKTKGFKWLEQNASNYGFEMSFSRNNKQGVSYEPWHWRYIGDDESKKTFKAARELN